MLHVKLDRGESTFGICAPNLRLLPNGSSQIPLSVTRWGTSDAATRFSYSVSNGFSLNTRSVNLDHVYAASSV